jgi:type II secretory pathway component GspD/PulD (secretin)/nucleoid-associated protein YgaU
MITLHTDELDVRQLLELMSRQNGLNILASPKVSGKITANFEKISADELVKSVLRLANLVEKVEGNVHFIYAKEEIRDETETKMKEKIVTKVYRLNYIRADEMMVMISPFLSADVGRKRFSTTANYPFGVSEASTLASGALGSMGGGAGGVAVGGMGMGGAAPGGAGTIQRGTQPPSGGLSLLGQDVFVIQDYESNLKIIDQIIQKLDVAPIQVLIEAVIIQVELDKEKQLGVNFAVVDNLGQQLGVIGSGFAINNNFEFNPAQVLPSAGKIAAGADTAGAAGAAGAVVDPDGFTSDTNGIKYGFISNNVAGFIRAIEALGSTKVLASPRILVLTMQRAEIQLGSRLGFKAITTQKIIGTTPGIQFLNIATLLRLRPFVSDDGMIRMEIHPERSTRSVDATTALPSQQTAELTTNVMVPNGTTLVIGGLIGNEDIYTQQGFPGLSRVPVLGALFGLKDKIDQRRELVVLLTPHILRDDRLIDPPADVSAKTLTPTSAERTGNSSRSQVSAFSVAAASAVALPGGTGPGSAAVESTSPMATKIGRWGRDRSWFQDRRAQPTSPPDRQVPGSRPSGLAREEEPVPRPDPSQPVRSHFQQFGLLEEAPEGARAKPPGWPAGRGDSVLVASSSAANRNLGEAGRMIESQTQASPPATLETASDPPTSFELLPAPSSLDTTDRRTTQIEPVVAQNHSPGRKSGSRPVDNSVVPASAQVVASKEKPTPATQAAVTQALQYHVLPGDSFESIARKFYGSKHHASLLWWANRRSVPWPEALKPGCIVIVPPLEQMAAARLAGSPCRSPTAAPAPMLVSTGPPAPFPIAVPLARGATEPRSFSDPQVEKAGLTSPQVRARNASVERRESQPNADDQPSNSAAEGGGYSVHIVRKDETLQSIAAQRLGDPRRSLEIADLNRDLLGKDARLTPGQRLLLPDDACQLRPGP